MEKQIAEMSEEERAEVLRRKYRPVLEIIKEQLNELKTKEEN